MASDSEADLADNETDEEEMREMREADEADLAENRPIWIPPVEVVAMEEEEEEEEDPSYAGAENDEIPGAEGEEEQLDVEDVEEDDWIEADWIRFWVVLQYRNGTGYQEQWWRATHGWAADGSVYWVLW